MFFLFLVFKSPMLRRILMMQDIGQLVKKHKGKKIFLLVFKTVSFGL